MKSTFYYESALPRLPVPTLVDTTRQLLAALKPLVSPEEYRQLIDESAHFMGHSTIALIQNHLSSVYANNPHLACYLSSINDETNPGIYGDLRGDILPRNPYLILEEDPYSKTINPPNQSQRAASLINSSLKFIVNLRNHSLKPDVTPKNATPLTMNCYNNLFGTTRIPHDSTSIKKSDINDSISVKKSNTNDIDSIPIQQSNTNDINSISSKKTDINDTNDSISKSSINDIDSSSSKKTDINNFSSIKTNTNDTNDSISKTNINDTNDSISKSSINDTNNSSSIKTSNINDTNDSISSKKSKTNDTNDSISKSSINDINNSSSIKTNTNDINSISIKKSSINDSRHIVILCNNQFYHLEVLTKASNNQHHQIWFNDYELSTILSSIIEQATKIDNIESINNSIGSFTTQSFTHWKLGRAELLKSNPHQLDIIDRALFVVVLDTINRPTNDQEKTAVISHGTSELKPGTNIQIGSCTSRWYDKLQIIVTQNSVAGVVWESTSMDSTAILRFISDIYTDSILKLAKNINGSEYTLFEHSIPFVSGKDQSKPTQNLITFNKTPELQNLIHLSETRLADIINQHEYKTLNVKIDTHVINKLGISIDSFLQVCFQMTNYTLYGKMANTLEPITTRKFRDARTELIPVQNDLILSLCKQYITTSNRESLWDLFIECCQNHTKQYHDAMMGKGFERHFTSLLHILKTPQVIEYLNKINQDKLPPLQIDELMGINVPLLSNPALDKITQPEIIISNCGNAALHLFGIPPAVDQGFGIGYIIHKDKVQITISSKHRQTDRFLDTFTRIIADLKQIVTKKSSVLVNLAESSNIRKNEFKALKNQNKPDVHIKRDSHVTKHPIDLAVDEKLKIPLDAIISSPDSSSNSSSLSGQSDDYDVLGGYGYFDFGEVDIRSDELSRNDSYLNSHSNLNSNHQSSTNLKNLHSDLRQKLSLSESIRDKLSHSEDSLARFQVSDRSGSQVFSNSAGPSGHKPRSQIGRELRVPNLP